MDPFSPEHFVHVKNEVASKSVFLSYASQDVDAARRYLRGAARRRARGLVRRERTSRRRRLGCVHPPADPGVRAVHPARFRQHRCAQRGLLPARMETRGRSLAPDGGRSHVPAAGGDRRHVEAAARVPGRFRERHWTRLPGGETSPAFTARVQGILYDESSMAPTVPALRVAAERVYSIAPTETSLAVLPFANMSADVDNEHFCDGLAEELLNALSKIDALKVAARTSAFVVQGQGRRCRHHRRGRSASRACSTAASGAPAIACGSPCSSSTPPMAVRCGRSATTARCATSSSCRTRSPWRSSQALKLKLFGEERAAVLKRYTDNAEAYQELFLKGRHHANEYTEQGWQRAIEFFEKADRAPAGLRAGPRRHRGGARLPVVLRPPAGRAGDPAVQGGQCARAGHRRRPGRRLSLAGHHHRSSTTGTGAAPNGRSSGRSSSSPTTARPWRTTRCSSPSRGVSTRP
ncbi:MAG: hypothetical protein MZV49_06110 [Rhodopseudomonas palustris]|nr:hypothetical protein [Rhodopseudomonas palustris]